MRRMVHDDDLRDELAHQGYSVRIGEWSETAHLDRYLGLIQGIKAGRPGQSVPPRPRFARLDPGVTRLGRGEDAGAA